MMNQIFQKLKIVLSTYRSNMVIMCKKSSCEEPAYYKNPGRENKVEYCSQHKKLGMIRSSSKQCEYIGCDKQPSYNIKGSKIAKFCKQHKKNGMVDVKNKQCEYSDCDKQPLYNIKGSKAAKFCKQHKKDEMININHKLCDYPSCDKEPSYNVKGSKVARFCKQHRNDDMVNVNNKRCEYPGCDKQPSYNIKGSKVTKFCKQHKKAGMINIKNKKCEYPNCDVRPSYNIKGSTVVRFCSQHKKDGMIDITHKLCEYPGCNILPCYNIKGSTVAKFCKQHRKNGMINIRHKLCEYLGCDKQPHYNIKGSKVARFCNKHKEDEMIDITSKRCEYIACNKIPLYNTKDSKVPRFCNQHKEDGMINIKHKSCEYPGCDIGPSYNRKGSKLPRFCNQHKKNGMVNVKYKSCKYLNCEKIAYYGYLFHPTSHCGDHKSPNMYRTSKIKPKCQHEDCKQQPLYCPPNFSYPERCEKHALPTDVNIIEKPCSVCGLAYFIPNDQTMCNSCKDYKDPRIRHAKELRIKAVLDANNIIYKAHDAIPEYACSRYRPDFIIECGELDIILEVDENQHSSYACECEIGRMIQLHQDFGGVPVVFIRYNPDNYKDHLNTLTRGQKQNNSRETLLVDLINRIQSLLVDDRYEIVSLSVYYLYYNGFDGVPNRKKLDYFNHTAVDISNGY